MEPIDLNATAYWHVRAVMSMIVSLSIAQLLRGIARAVQHPGQKKAYWIHAGWVVSTFLLVIHFWWWEVRISEVAPWIFGHYAFLVFFSSLFYFLCVLLLPDQMDEYPGFREYFWSRRKWFFGILALIFCADIVDTVSKGNAHLTNLGIEYLVRAGAYVVLCIVAMFAKSERFQASFLVVNLIYQVSWILRTYNVLS